MSELIIPDRAGDTRISWDPNKKDEVEAVRKTFDKLRKKGYYAYKVGEGGEKGEIAYSFDPDAAKIIMALPMRGG